MIENMKVEFGRTSDIDSWMQLVRKVSWNFPGLETEQSIDEHKIMVCGEEESGLSRSCQLRCLDDRKSQI